MQVMKLGVLGFLLLTATACAWKADSAREAPEVIPGSRPASTDAASRTGLVYAAVVLAISVAIAVLKNSLAGH